LVVVVVVVAALLEALLREVLPGKLLPYRCRRRWRFVNKR